MLLLAIAAFALQAEQPLITFESPCISTPALVAELSKQSGEPMYVVGDPTKFDQAVRFDHVPLNVVMTKLANAYASEWVRRGEGYQLQASSSKYQLEQANLYSQRKNEVIATQKDLREELAETEVLTQERAEDLFTKVQHNVTKRAEGDSSQEDPVVSECDGFSASRRALLRLMLLMNPDQLASIKPGSRVIFSDRPTRMEQPLPAGGMEVVQDYFAEEHRHSVLWHEIERRQNPEDRDEYEWEAGPARFLFLLTSEDATDVSAEMMTVGNNGAELDIDDETYDPDDDDDADESSDAKVAVAEVHPLSYESIISRIRFTNSEKKFASLLDSRSGGSHLKVLDPETKFALTHPDLVPPGSLVVGPCLLRAVKKKPENLLAVLDDSDIVEAHAAVASSGYNNWAVPTSLFKEESGWLEIHPSDHAVAASSQFDRKSLARFLQSASENGDVSFDDELSLAMSSPVEALADSSLPAAYAAVSIMEAESLFSESGVLSLQLYASLTDAQKLAARGKLLFSALSVEQQDVLNKMVFDGSDELDVEPELPDDRLPKRCALYMPEESLPNGIPFSGYLTLSEGRSNVIFLTSPDEDKSISKVLLDPEYFGNAYVDVKGADISLQCGSRTTSSISFQFSPRVSLAQTFANSVATGAKVHRLEELPPEMLAIINKSIEEAKKEKEEADTDGDTTPAPPR